MEPRQVMASHYTASKSQQNRVGKHPERSPGSETQPRPFSILHDRVKALYIPYPPALRFPLTLLLTAMNTGLAPQSLLTSHQVLTCLLQVEGLTASVQCVLVQSGESYSACS